MLKLSPIFVNISKKFKNTNIGRIKNRSKRVCKSLKFSKNFEEYSESPKIIFDIFEFFEKIWKSKKIAQNLFCSFSNFLKECSWFTKSLKMCFQGFQIFSRMNFRIFRKIPTFFKNCRIFSRIFDCKMAKNVSYFQYFHYYFKDVLACWIGSKMI